MPQGEFDPVPGIAGGDELDRALDGDARGCEARDQQPLMLVLREDVEEGISGQPLANCAEGQLGSALPAHPEIDRLDAVPGAHDIVGQADLPVQFQRSCLHGKRTRGCSGLRHAVDDPWPDAELA